MENSGTAAPTKAYVYFFSLLCSPGATKAHNW